LGLCIFRQRPCFSLTASPRDRKIAETAEEPWGIEIRLRRGILGPEGGNGGGDFLLEDFDEFLVSVDDFLLGFDLGKALLLITDPFDKLRTGYADYTDLGIRVYKCMRIYLWGAI